MGSLLSIGLTGLGLYWVRRGFTDSRRAQAALAAANAAKSRFLAHMGHEIRAPMNAMLGLAQVLEGDALAPAQRQMVQRIRAAGCSLLGIINDILDFSKIEAGQIRVETLALQTGAHPRARKCL